MSDDLERRLTVVETKLQLQMEQVSKDIQMMTIALGKAAEESVRLNSALFKRIDSHDEELIAIKMDHAKAKAWAIGAGTGFGLLGGILWEKAKKMLQ